MSFFSTTRPSTPTSTSSTAQPEVKLSTASVASPIKTAAATTPSYLTKVTDTAQKYAYNSYDTLKKTGTSIGQSMKANPMLYIAGALVAGIATGKILASQKPKDTENQISDKDALKILKALNDI